MPRRTSASPRPSTADVGPGPAAAAGADCRTGAALGRQEPKGGLATNPIDVGTTNGFPGRTSNRPCRPPPGQSCHPSAGDSGALTSRACPAQASTHRSQPPRSRHHHGLGAVGRVPDTRQLHYSETAPRSDGERVRAVAETFHEGQCRFREINHRTLTLRVAFSTARASPHARPQEMVIETTFVAVLGG